MNIARKLFYLSFALLFIFSLLPFAALYSPTPVQAATYNLTKSTSNPLVSADISASNGTVIYDSGLYKMWYVETTVNDTTNSIREYLYSLLSSYPSLLNALRAADFSAVAANGTDIKAVLTELAGLTPEELTNYLNSITTTLRYKTSSDGIIWNDGGAVTFGPVTVWDQFISSPNVIRDSTDNNYKMWYTGYTISANDLQALFVALNAADLTPANISTLLNDIISRNITQLRTDIINLSLQPEITDILSEALVLIDSSKPAIGYASSSDGLNWTKDTVTATGGWDSAGVMTPSVIKNTNGTYDMWYTGIDITINLSDLSGATSVDAIETALLNGVNIAIGHATSTNGTSWSKDAGAVLVKGISTDWDSHCVFAPSVIRNADGTYDMWYTGGKGILNTFFDYLNDTGTLDNAFLTGLDTAIGHATSTNGTFWVKDTLNPVLSKGTGSAWDNYGVAFPSVVANAGYMHMWYTGVTASPAAALTSFLDGNDLNTILTGTSMKIGYAKALIPTSGGGGGGGGGGGTPGVTNVFTRIASNGTFLEDVIAYSGDRMCYVTILKDTVGITPNGTAIWEVRILNIDPQPTLPSDLNGIGLFYNLGIEGTTFSPPITISFSYRGLTLPAGADEEDIIIIWKDAKGDWNPLECTVDTVNKIVSAKISHFTPFGLVIPSATAISFTTTNLTVSPSEVQVNQPATVSVLVTNTGTLSRSFDVELKIDGTVADTETTGILASGDSKTVTFTVVKALAGIYDIVIGTESGKLTVKEATTTPTINPAKFDFSNLSITPFTMKPGDTATVSVTVTNTGDRQGTYTVNLKVNGVVEKSKDVTLAGGGSTSVSFTLTKSQVGTYAISIDTLSASLVVQTTVTTTPTSTTSTVEPTKPTSWTVIGGAIIGGMLGLFLAFLVMQRLQRPAVFSVSDLSIIPSVVKPGTTVKVVAKVTNTGNRQGTYKIVLKVNNVVESSLDLTLSGSTNRAVNFTLVKNNPGIYVISIDNASGRLVVQEPTGTESPQIGRIRPSNWPGISR